MFQNILTKTICLTWNLSDKISTRSWSGKRLRSVVTSPPWDENTAEQLVHSYSYLPLLHPYKVRDIVDWAASVLCDNTTKDSNTVHDQRTWENVPDKVQWLRFHSPDASWYYFRCCRPPWVLWELARCQVSLELDLRLLDVLEVLALRHLHRPELGAGSYREFIYSFISQF